MRRYWDLQAILGLALVVFVVLTFAMSVYLWGHGTATCEKGRMRYYGYIGGELYCMADDGRLVMP